MITVVRRDTGGSGHRPAAYHGDLEVAESPPGTGNRRLRRFPCDAGHSARSTMRIRPHHAALRKLGRPDTLRLIGDSAITVRSGSLATGDRGTRLQRPPAR